MSVIIRLQNLPWSANALDIRNFFRGLSIPEGGVHIVGGELGDAFIAFSTDEDARQAMMLDCGKIKEIQVKLLLSSRSEMHKVIETARQSVPLITLAPAPAPAVHTPAPLATPPQPVALPQPAITPFSAALGNVSLSGFGIPGIGNPLEIPQPAVIEPPAPLISPTGNLLNGDDDNDDRSERKLSKEKDRRRTRSRSKSRDRDRKDRKRERRDRSRSRERRRRDRSRSRERRDRKRDRKERSRSRDRSPGSRRARERRGDRRDARDSQEKTDDVSDPTMLYAPIHAQSHVPVLNAPLLPNGPGLLEPPQSRFTDPSMAEAFSKLQELGKKRNPNAFQGEAGTPVSRTSSPAPRAPFRRDGRVSRFDDQQRDCCVAVKNAPTHTSYGDVRRFFPYIIDKHGIKMINDSMGRRTGNIYVRFCEQRSKQLALQRKGSELKGAIVAVEHLDDDAYEAAVDSFLPYRDDNDEEDASLVIADQDESRAPYSVLKLTELPHFVKEHDIIKAFSDFSLLSILLNDCRVSRSKIAFVQFAKPEDAQLAYERRELYMFGRRQPVITPVADEHFEREKLEQPERGEAPPPTAPRDPRQRRQPDSGPRAPAPHAHHGQPFFPGAPFVQQNFGAPFHSGPQFFPNAGTMDPRAAAAHWANRPAFHAATAAGTSGTESAEADDQPLDCVLMKGLPRAATDRTIVTFLSDTGAVPARIHLMLDAGGLPSGDCFCEFRSVQEARKAASKHGRDLEGSRITIDLVSRKVVEEALEGPKQPDAKPMQQYYEHPRGGFAPRPFRGRGGFDRGGFRGGFERGGFRGRGGPWGERGARGFGRGRGGFGRGRGGFENGGREPPAGTGAGGDEESDPALEGFGAPGCVVCMENVPFRASVEDILSFFSDFELTQDDIIRRYNERGQPTGDARVAFRSPRDAQRAVRDRNTHTIHERRISLAIL
ncbi:RNA-binding protein 12 [Battus philenor]|uniref:RNA-binding protein 12 n=1 Tax=Battus philenor TaxID=42288 RepID=UPI0035D01141